MTNPPQASPCDSSARLRACDGATVYDFGVRTRTELLSAGVHPSTISARCRTGRYHRLLPQIYAVIEPTTRARCYAVTVWQPRAILSHRTAAWLHGLLPEPETIEATIPPTIRVRCPAWLHLYRRTLEPGHIDDESALPTVTKEQALFDCIAVMDGVDRDRLVDRCMNERIAPEAIRLTCKHNAHRWGAPAARRQLREYARDFASEAERVLGRALNERGFAMTSNVWVDGYVVDFVDELARLVVEVDGREFHSEPGVFRSDRRRQNHLQLKGWLVLRYAAADVLHHPERAANEIISVARRRRAARR